MLALYLRPSQNFINSHITNSNALNKAQLNNKDFGGLHSTLCSFAVNNTTHEQPRHMQPLESVMDAIQELILHCQMQDNNPFQYNSSYEAPLEPLLVDGKWILIFLGGKKTFEKVCSMTTDAGLHKARERLHISCGSEKDISEIEIKEICDLMNRCIDWELVVMSKAENGSVAVFSEISPRIL